MIVNMQKNFDAWNSNKKKINENLSNKMYHTREIWWCYLGLNVGYEQDGSGAEFMRPVLVLKGLSRYVCLIIPLTTSTKKNPYHSSLGIVAGKESFAIISQIRLIDTKRLINKVGYLDIQKFEEIRKIVKDFL